MAYQKIIPYIPVQSRRRKFHSLIQSWQGRHRLSVKELNENSRLVLDDWLPLDCHALRQQIARSFLYRVSHAHYLCLGDPLKRHDHNTFQTLRGHQHTIFSFNSLIFPRSSETQFTFGKLLKLQECSFYYLPARTVYAASQNLSITY